MPIISARVTVTASPTLIIDPRNGSTTGPVTGIVKNDGPTSIYLGGAGVTAATGFLFEAGTVIDVELITGDLLYGITAAGTQEVMTMKLMS